MMWYDHDVGGWWWLTMGFGMVVFWGLLVAAVVLLVRAVDRGRDLEPRSPERILSERYARGEIDDEEYRRRLGLLGQPKARP